MMLEQFLLLTHAALTLDNVMMQCEMRRGLVALVCVAAIARSTESEKLLIFVTGLQGSGTTMVCRVLGHAPHAIAFGGRTHPEIPLELHAWRELLLSVGNTTDSTWEAADRLELIASPPDEASCSRQDGHGRANATLKRALKQFTSARGCAGCASSFFRARLGPRVRAR